MYVSRRARVRDRLLSGVVQVRVQGQLRVSVHRLRLGLFRRRHGGERVREESKRLAQHFRTPQVSTARCQELFQRLVLKLHLLASLSHYLTSSRTRRTRRFFFSRHLCQSLELNNIAL